ncbi:hypothetical protein SAMN03159448_05228 [Sinorhizobium sp. NFACC03]|nr:hypothetical protein SAMN03159448_05228 [Sinorhizobium sp. NFACC03]
MLLKSASVRILYIAFHLTSRPALSSPQVRNACRWHFIAVRSRPRRSPAPLASQVCAVSRSPRPDHRPNLHSSPKTRAQSLGSWLIIQAGQFPPGVFELRACRLPGGHGLRRSYARQNRATCPFNGYDHAPVPVVFCDPVRNRSPARHRLAVASMKRSGVVAIDRPKKMNVKEVSAHLRTRTPSWLSTS